MTQRVVVTGMAGLSPVGSTWETVRTNLEKGRSGVVVIPEWADYEGLDTRLGAPVHDFAVPGHYPRKKTRSMGRVSLLATRATELALATPGCSSPALSTDDGRRLRLDDGQSARDRGLRAARPHAPQLKGISRNRLHPVHEPHLRGQPGASSSGSAGASSPPAAPARRAARASATPTRRSRAAQQAAMIAGGAEELHVDQRRRLRHHVRDVDAQRRARPRRRVRSTRAATAWWSARARARWCSRSSSTPPARGAPHPRRDRRLRHQLRRRAHDATRTPRACSASMRARARATPVSTPTAIDYVNAHGTATEQGDIAESRATDARVRRRDADQLAQGLHRPHARRLRRDRGWITHRDDARGLVRPDPEPRRGRSALRARSTTCAAHAARLDSRVRR